MTNLSELVLRVGYAQLASSVQRGFLLRLTVEGVFNDKAYKTPQAFLSLELNIPYSLEKPVNIRIDVVDDRSQVLGLVTEIVIINIHDQHFAQVVSLHPGFIAFIKVFKVVEPDVVLIFSAALLNLFHNDGDGGTKVDEKVGGLDERTHQVKKGKIIFKVTGTHQTHAMKVWSKNVCIFINRPVLDDLIARLANSDDLTETAVQKIYLEVEGPPLHVLVKVVEVGIIVHIFVLGLPAIMFCEQAGEGGLPRPDIPGYGYMHIQ